VRDAVNRKCVLAALKAVQLDGGPGRCLLGGPQAWWTWFCQPSRFFSMKMAGTRWRQLPETRSQRLKALIGLPEAGSFTSDLALGLT
jgi:hypothetical protein